MRITPPREGHVPTVPSASSSSPSSADTNLKRRRFLFALSAGGAAGAAAAATGPAAAVPLAGATQPEAKGPGYRETQHVRDYYATTRL